MPDVLKNVWEDTPARFFDMTEYELRKHLRESCGPEQREFSLLTKIRIAFWEEYERAARAGERMFNQNLFRGVCRNNIYWDTYRKYPGLLAWVVCPLAGYLLQRKELEFLAEERMLEVMGVSAVKPDGKVDSRLAKVQFEMYQTIQDRNHGPVVQKVQSEQKSVNVNVNSQQNAEESANTIALITDVSELDRRIEEVRKKRAALREIKTIEVDQNRLMRPDLEVVDEK
jgi:hypothetical protein